MTLRTTAGSAGPDRGMVSRLIDFLESFQPRELVRFDEQRRSYYSGIRWSEVRRLRGGGEPDGDAGACETASCS